MSRIFAYCRVSTGEQTTENQILELKTRGYDIPAARVVSETISGSVAAMERPAFAALVNHKLEAGDQLVVLKLDRLGRNNMDIERTILMLAERGIRVTSLDLPFDDLTTAEGTLMRQIFGAFAQFERARIRERSIEGQNRARAQGKHVGRPAATDTREAVQRCKAKGLSQSKTAAELGLNISTIKRHWK